MKSIKLVLFIVLVQFNLSLIHGQIGRVSIYDTSYNSNQMIVQVQCVGCDSTNLNDTFQLNFALENHTLDSINFYSNQFEYTGNYILGYDTLTFFHPKYMHDLKILGGEHFKVNQSWKFEHYLMNFNFRNLTLPFMQSCTWPNGYYYDTITDNYMYGGFYGHVFYCSINNQMDSIFLEADYIGVEADFLRFLPYGDCDSNVINISVYDSTGMYPTSPVYNGALYAEEYMYSIPEDSILHIQKLISPENFGAIHIGLDHYCNTYFDNLRLYPVYNRYICQGDSIEINGLFVFDEGVYIDSLFTALGTDSIIGINIKFNDILHGDTIQAEFCEGNSYIVNDTLTLLTEGLHEILTTSIHGCDSLFYFNLEERLNTISTSITNTNNVLSYNDPQSDYTYQWINVLTGQPIVGETSSTFIPSDNGTYAVEVSNGVCTQVSISSLTNIGLKDLAGEITCTPNPFANSIELSFGNNPLSGFVKVFDVNSKLLITSDFSDTESLSLDTEHLPNGIYLIKIKTNNGLYQKKMIK